MPFPAGRRASFAACLVVALSAALLAPATPALAGSSAGLFGTREQFSADLAPFTKWDGVVARTDREAQRAPELCRGVDPDRFCAASWWRDFVAALARLPLRERVERANAVLNRVNYVTAEANWHDRDHWETPLEFLERGGQCQDYAIAKFMALAASGVPQTALRLVVVHDAVSALDHAVTVAYVDGEALVLDNQVKDVVPANRLARYVPYYSINRTGWWYHQTPPRAAIEIARTEVPAR